MPFSHRTGIIMSVVGKGKGSGVEMEPQSQAPVKAAA